MNTNHANFCLKFSENTSGTCETRLRYFVSLENARKFMGEEYGCLSRILKFPKESDENAREDHQTIIDGDSIHVAMGLDRFDWSIESIKAKDAMELLSNYPEQEMYDKDDHCLDLKLDDPIDEYSVHEVIWDIADERYYCFLHGAESMDEALGHFFKKHPHVTYDMVVFHDKI